MRLFGQFHASECIVDVSIQMRLEAICTQTIKVKKYGVKTTQMERRGEILA